MTASELRTFIETAGGSLHVERGKLVITAPLGGLSSELEAAIERHRNALVAHVALFPCVGCGRTPGITPLKCIRCASRAARQRTGGTAGTATLFRENPTGGDAA